MPKIYAPLFTTSIGPRLIARTAEEKKKLIAPGIWAATSILTPFIGFLVLTVAPIGRRIDGRSAAPAGWARVTTWMAALFAVLSVSVFGAAIGATYKSSEVLLLFGMLPWAKGGALAGLRAGIAGVVAVVRTLRAHLRQRLPIGTLLGFSITGLAAISLCVFLFAWGLGPF